MNSDPQDPEITLKLGQYSAKYQASFRKGTLDPPM